MQYAVCLLSLQINWSLRFTLSKRTHVSIEYDNLMVQMYI